MTRSNRKSRFRRIVPASLALVAACAMAPAVAADADADKPSGVCRQEIQRVAVYPKGGPPKVTHLPRYENREVTVCNGKVVPSQPEQKASR